VHAVRVLTINALSSLYNAVGLFVPVYTVVALAKGMPKMPIAYAALVGLIVVSLCVCHMRMCMPCVFLCLCVVCMRVCVCACVSVRMHVLYVCACACKCLCMCACVVLCD